MHAQTRRHRHALSTPPTVWLHQGLCSRAPDVAGGCLAVTVIAFGSHPPLCCQVGGLGLGLGRRLQLATQLLHLQQKEAAA